MPAWPSRSPWAIPHRFAWLSAFPQRKVTGVPFSFVNFNPGTRLKLFGISVAKFSIIFIFGNIKIDIAHRCVSKSFFDQAADHRLNFANIMSRSGKVINARNLKFLEVGKIICSHSFSEFSDRSILFF